MWVENNTKKTIKRVSEKDVREEFIRTSGSGGQRKNKVSTAVRLTHWPTGIQVVADQQRLQSQNRTEAWSRLREKILEIENSKNSKSLNNSRKSQLEANNCWTWTEWRDSVKGPNGESSSYKKSLKGFLENLLKS